MFRKPRDDVTPSVGRPPSPPHTRASDLSHVSAAPPAANAPIMAARIENTSQTPKRPTTNPTTPSSKLKSASTGKNRSILNFFQKSAPDSSTSSAFNTLFLQERATHKPSETFQNPPPSGPDCTVSESETLKLDSDGPQALSESFRFNEESTPNKRRRLSLSPSAAIDTELQYRDDDKGIDEKVCTPPPPPPAEADEVDKSIATEDIAHDQSQTRHVGPFLDDSDSDNESPFGNNENETIPVSIANSASFEKTPYIQSASGNKADAAIPSLKREETSVPEETIFADFEGMGDFDDDYAEGEEFRERRFYLEQRRLELQEQGLEDEIDDEELRDFGLDGATEIGDEELGDIDVNGAADIDDHLDDGQVPQGEEDSTSIPSCPVCNASFAGVSDQEASVHVNHCLDGNPTPLPSLKAVNENPTKLEEPPTVDQSNFRRPKRPAKPGQTNPFSLGQPTGTSSAFSKLMSAHAEDAAWASAAASEHAARGKPSYQRTCPFYKILPGFSICVDAFRYGAVQGCNAYFLSHFHSDHYVGLTASWNHGPIYCSRPTANLVRQQLRVDPRFVIDVEFEKKIEVPATNGVQVTMIPANHCPGSSLFLFEKTIGAGKTPKVQRVLHCGDFRACPAHVEHPLLKPEVLDSVTGKTHHQKLDVCYLDTTYLNPRYAFPSQEDVIQACADMCVSLNKEKTDPNDNWEQMKKERAGTSMASFVRKASATDEAMDTSHEPEQKQEQEQEQAPQQPTNGDSVLSDAQPPNSIQLSTSTDQSANSTRGRLLVVVGTYSIGKERMCVGIARALNSKIYAPPGKTRIVACLEDSELSRLLTADPRAAQVHMTPLFEIRAETLAEYLGEFRSTFARAVAFRPSGWNYRPPGSRFTESPAVTTVLFSDSWKSRYSVRDLVPQRGSNSRAATYGVPYSEHSSFRELTMFCCALRIDKIIPTVNVGSAKSRERMKVWVERWNTYKKKEGLFKIAARDAEASEGEPQASNSAGSTSRAAWYAGKGTWELRTTL